MDEIGGARLRQAKPLTALNGYACTVETVDRNQVASADRLRFGDTSARIAGLNGVVVAGEASSVDDGSSSAEKMSGVSG